MTRSNLSTVFILLASIGIISCSKRDEAPNLPVIPPVTSPDSVSNTIVYTAGSIGSKTDSHAVYWINDSLINLSAISSGCQSITVSGNDIYIGGTNGDTVGYWKNNSFVPLFQRSAYGGFNITIAVSGNDVYASGNATINLNSIAEYWKNGTGIKLSPDTVSTTANSIVVSGSDVYVAGTQGFGLTALAMYWKNGVKTILTDGTRYAYANAIAVSGTDVYVAGGESDFSGTHLIAKYWKNGVPVAVTDSNSTAFLYAIAVSGNNVYVAGDEKDGDMSSTAHVVPKYWKNGTATVLTSAFYGIAYSIAVNGSDIYVAYSGDLSSTNFLATYAKNGVTVKLTDGTFDALAEAIFVKK